MKYPIEHPSVIDITKSPYFADNTGQTDTTNAIRQALDDCVQGYISGLEKLRNKLLALAAESDGNVYIGAEAGRVINGEVYMTMPEEAPPDAELIVTTGFWKHPADECIRAFASNLGIPAVELSALGELREMKAIGLFEHSGVANHPGDTGMQAIADRIMEKLIKTKAFNK